MKTFTIFPLPQCRLRKLCSAVLISVSLLISCGLTAIPSGEMQNDSLKDKKLKLLEKLENGNTLKSEEIMSSFLHGANKDETTIPFDNEFNDMYGNLYREFLHSKDRHCNPGNPDEINVATDQFRKVHDQLRKELEKLRDEMIRLKSELSEMNLPSIM